MHFLQLIFTIWAQKVPYGNLFLLYFKNYELHIEIETILVCVAMAFHDEYLILLRLCPYL